MADPLPFPGAPAPDFTAQRPDGEDIALAALRGKKVVLYFYPKDDTPGCTTEAINFTENAAEFEAAGAIVIGVSKDTVDSHRRFKAKHNLAVELVSDPDGAICEAYGVWVEKNMYGRKSMGIARTTFLIDAEGIVRHVWPKVKVPGHVAEVLAKTRALSA